MLLRARSFLWGNRRPGPSFWLAQYSILIALSAGPFLAFFLFLTRAGGRPWAPGNGSLFLWAVALVYLIPVLGLLQHLVAVARSARHANSRTGRIFCWVYVPAFALLVGGLITGIAWSNFRLFQSKARQSEAKIALAELFKSEQAFLSANGRYSADWQALGYAPDSRETYHSYAILLCDNSVKAARASFSSPKLVGGEAARARLLAGLRERLDRESCADRSRGFTILAIGPGASAEALDLWRIDEHRQLAQEDLRSGL